MDSLDIKTHEILKDCNSFMNSIQKLSLKDIREFAYNFHTKIEPIQKELHDRLVKDSK